MKSLTKYLTFNVPARMGFENITSTIEEAVEVAQDIGAERTLLTHLTHETSHAELPERLPPGIEPGYDGMRIEI